MGAKLGRNSIFNRSDTIWSLIPRCRQFYYYRFTPSFYTVCQNSLIQYLTGKVISCMSVILIQFLPKISFCGPKLGHSSISNRNGDVCNLISRCRQYYCSTTLSFHTAEQNLVVKSISNGIGCNG